MHAIPELGFELERTRAFLANALSEISVDVDPNRYGRSGLVAVINGEHPGPTVMVRADMDALPIEEISARPWKSRISGNSHACGHDGPMAIGLSVARSLIGRKHQLPGNVVFCF